MSAIIHALNPERVGNLDAPATVCGLDDAFVTAQDGSVECPKCLTALSAKAREPEPERPATDTPTPDDWPIDGLLRARAELERWAREQGILDADRMLVVEVRAVRRRGEVFGAQPQSALVVHHGEAGWS